MAQRLAPSDAQRIVRALEVYDATGQSLSAWWQQAGAPLIAAGHAVKLVVARTRTDLHARCDVRFDAMMAAGALDEVGALARLDLAADLPAMRALGVRPLMAHLAGTCSLADAVAQAKLETRQYVKRQQTWLRRQMADWQPVAPEVVEFDRPIFERT
jgi:tRNA dimethylallyltransferase